MIEKKEEGKRKNYLLKNVDPELWKKFKISSTYFGMSMRQMLIDAIENWAFLWEHREEVLRKVEEGKNEPEH